MPIPPIEPTYIASARHKKRREALKCGEDITDAPAASGNVTLAALTSSWGVLFKRDTPAQELPKPDKEGEVPDPTNLNVDQTIGARA